MCSSISFHLCPAFSNQLEHIAHIDITMPCAFDKGIDNALLENDIYKPLLKVSKCKHNKNALLVLV